MTKHGLWWLVLVLVGTTGCPDSSLTGRDPIPWDGYRFPFRDIDRAGDLDVATQDGTADEIGPQACLSDGDCPEGMFCDLKSSTCVGCYLQEQCRPGELCQNNECVALPPCGPGKECPEGTYCLELLNLCVACIVDEQCPQDYICDKYECLPRPPCETDQDCAPPMVCSPHLGVCVECLNDGDCTLDQWCEIDSGRCMADFCTPGVADCVAGGFMVCLENGSGFGELIPCPEGTYCDNGECIPIKVCIPGESVCLSTMALKLCAEDGNSWTSKQCAPEETCVDLGNNHAACQSGCTTWCDEIPMGTCAPDGCGGICNMCSDGDTCDPEVFNLGGAEFLPCVPSCSCEGRECGTDGCGPLVRPVRPGRDLPGGSLRARRNHLR